MHYEDSLEWYFDPELCKYSGFEDYQRLVLHDNVSDNIWLSTLIFYVSYMFKKCVKLRFVICYKLLQYIIIMWMAEPMYILNSILIFALYIQFGNIWFSIMDADGLRNVQFVFYLFSQLGPSLWVSVQDIYNQASMNQKQN